MAMDVSEFELLRDFRPSPFRLELYLTHRETIDRRDILAYRLSIDGQIVFEGQDFASSPVSAIDSDKTLGALLTFLSLRPGDTDADYFRDYSQAQLEFVGAHGETLQLIAMELNEGKRDADDIENEFNA